MGTERDPAERTFLRLFYHDWRPTQLGRIVNRVTGWRSTHRYGPPCLQSIEVRGRTSGKARSTPVVVATVDGERYLVSMLGDRSEWVRNVEAADGRAALRHGEREDVRLVAVPTDERAPILREYVRIAESGRRHIPVGPTAPISEFAEIVDRYPVFRVEPAAAIDRGRISTDVVWNAISRASFAVVCHVTSRGRPRSSGVVYAAVDRRLYVVVASDSWKARQITTGQRVSVTVPVRRGGMLSLVAPIPPATISFEATAAIHPARSREIRSISRRLSRILPPSALDGSCVIELVPEGSFLAYGIGVSVMSMRRPDVARMRVPVS